MIIGLDGYRDYLIEIGVPAAELEHLKWYEKMISDLSDDESD